jgi:hypothetical protein
MPLFQNDAWSYLASKKGDGKPNLQPHSSWFEIWVDGSNPLFAVGFVHAFFDQFLGSWGLVLKGDFGNGAGGIGSWLIPFREVFRFGVHFGSVAGCDALFRGFLDFLRIKFVVVVWFD